MINLYCSSTFYQAIDDDLPSLKATVKATCGKNIRRADRFIQLSLIGAYLCVDSIELPAETGLYMTSVNGSLGNAFGVLREIYCDKQPPMPLSFVNTVSNAACFYVARELGLQSQNMFITRDKFGFESVIRLSLLDIASGRVDAALVGAVAECAEPLSVHRRRLRVADGTTVAEGSHWFLLAQDLPGHQPIAHINKFLECVGIGAVTDYIGGHTFDGIVYGSGLSGDEAEQINIGLQNSPNIQQCRWHTELGFYEFSSGHALTRLTQAPELRGQRWLHIDGNSNGQYYLVDLSNSSVS